MDWSLVDTNPELLRFFRTCIAFRRAHSVLRNRDHHRNCDYVGSGFGDLAWHGTQVGKPDWSPSSRMLAFMLCGEHSRGGSDPDDDVYVAMNMCWDGHSFELPTLPDGERWYVFANTGAAAPEDVWEPGREVVLENQHSIFVGPRSAVILVGKRQQ
jgi:glycogen operon protein